MRVTELFLDEAQEKVGRPPVADLVNVLPQRLVSSLPALVDDLLGGVVLLPV